MSGEDVFHREKRNVPEAGNRGGPRDDRRTPLPEKICANRLVELVQAQRGERILDLSAGAVDAANETTRTIRAPMRVAEVERVDLLNDPFDAVICNFGMLPLIDVLAALHEYLCVTKPDGRVLFSCLGSSTFRPLAGLCEQRLRRYGVLPPPGNRSWTTQHPIDAEACRDVLRTAGYRSIEVRAEQLGYYAMDARQWWEIAGSSGLLDVAKAQLSVHAMARYQAEHLAEVDALATERGVWIDIAATFATGRK